MQRVRQASRVDAAIYLVRICQAADNAFSYRNVAKVSYVLPDSSPAYVLTDSSPAMSIKYGKHFSWHFAVIFVRYRAYYMSWLNCFSVSQRTTHRKRCKLWRFPRSVCPETASSLSTGFMRNPHRTWSKVRFYRRTNRAWGKGDVTSLLYTIFLRFTFVWLCTCRWQCTHV